MHLSTTVFTEIEFWGLIAFSVLLPFWIYWWLLSRRSISSISVFFFGIALIAIAGVDVYLLQRLSTLAKLSTSLSDDEIFSSEISLALYLLPALFGGVGINLVSHVLLKRLSIAERKFKHDHPDD